MASRSRNAGRKVRSSRAFQTLAALVKAEEPFCGICGRWINPDLKWPHPMSFSADHVVPVDADPDLALIRSNLRASHLRCNVSRGATYGNRKRGRRYQPSRSW